MQKRVNKADTAKIFLVLFFLLLIILPLVRMFLNISRESIEKIISSDGFGTIIKNSVVSAAVTTLISIVLAYIAALCLERVENRIKGFFSVIFILPLLIPSDRKSVV